MYPSVLESVFFHNMPSKKDILRKTFFLCMVSEGTTKTSSTTDNRRNEVKLSCLLEPWKMAVIKRAVKKKIRKESCDTLPLWYFDQNISQAFHYDLRKLVSTFEKGHNISAKRKKIRKTTPDWSDILWCMYLDWTGIQICQQYSLYLTLNCSWFWKLTPDRDAIV